MEKTADVLMFKPDQWGHIAKFSSLGPTFDNRIKPDVVAPDMSSSAPLTSFYQGEEDIRKSTTGHVSYKGKDYYFMAQSGTVR